jgi:undecaprenyl-diphosphatase
MAIHEAVLYYVAAGDHRLMRRVHRWMPPRWFRVWMVMATRAGDGWLWAALGLLIVAAGGPEHWRACGSGASAAGSSIAVFEVLKRLAGRRRPCDIEPHCWATLLPPDRFSFPSGHSMTAFALCASLSLAYPVLFSSLLVCAVSIALSRILLGMHFLSDVIAGAALGVLIGMAAHSVLY